MAQQHFFVTGAMGCIGAWVVRNLIQDSAQVTVFDLSKDRHRLELIMTPDELSRVIFIQGDLTQTQPVCDAVTSSSATHIIHLGALQVPFCKADPPVGAAVNVLGTVNMFEAAKAAGIRQLVYASSVGVYGTKDMYEESLVQHNTPLYPLNHYGVYKQANEGSARVYWRDDQIASIGFRPYTVYGPGRDQGMTSTPTQAMLAAARGEAYHISFGGSNGFQFVDDIAKLFIQAARHAIEGSDVFNIRGAVAHMSEVVAAIHAVLPDAEVTHESDGLPFPDGQVDTELRQTLGEIPDTPLTVGVEKTIRHFQTAIQDGRLPQST
ncbi:MAG: NAD-dependent epimerase/dehydratase [Pseudomonadota bacterium]|nr:NAD-dependent epimerase/dehydratase [Pseudomonadota bacterium]